MRQLRTVELGIVRVVDARRRQRRIDRAADRHDPADRRAAGVAQRDRAADGERCTARITAQPPPLARLFAAQAWATATTSSSGAGTHTREVAGSRRASRSCPARSGQPRRPSSPRPKNARPYTNPPPWLYSASWALPRRRRWPAQVGDATPPISTKLLRSPFRKWGRIPCVALVEDRHRTNRRLRNDSGTDRRSLWADHARQATTPVRFEQRGRRARPRSRRPWSASASAQSPSAALGEPPPQDLSLRGLKGPNRLGKTGRWRKQGDRGRSSQPDSPSPARPAHAPTRPNGLQCDRLSTAQQGPTTVGLVLNRLQFDADRCRVVAVDPGCAR